MVKQIPINQDKFTLVDDAYYEYAISINWFLSTYGYAKSDIYNNRERKTIFLHQEIMGKKDGFEIDHINGNRLDNRLENLRFVTRSQNNMNSKKRSNCLSKYKGVCKSRKKWRAYITKDGKTKHIGVFEKEKDAAIAYDEEAKNLFGEYARLNNP